MLTPGFSSSPSLTLAAITFGLVMAALSPNSLAGATEVPVKAIPPSIESSSLDPAASYKSVDLKALVANSQTEVPGQRIIFAPSPVMFRATLSSLPSPQKADYLLAALSMMKISNPPKVTQRIGLEYGGKKAIAAYIDDSVAERLSKEAKAGQVLTFYAFHVYNYSRGPALLITSYEQ